MKTKVIYSLLLLISKTHSSLLLIDSDSLIISPIREYSNTEVAEVTKYLIELGYIKGIWQNAPTGSGYTCWVNGLTQLGLEYVRKYIDPVERIRRKHQEIQQINQEILRKNQKTLKKTEQLLAEVVLRVAESRKLRCCCVSLNTSIN